MKIRRYLGYDCNSEEGFNSGHYIDDDFIEVTNWKHAERLCLEALSEYLGRELTANEVEDTAQGDGICLEVITGHYDNDGNEISAEQYQELTDDDEWSGSYRYVFVACYKEKE